MDVDLHDWEVLDDVQNTGFLDGIEGMIRSDHFSIDSSANHVETVTNEISVEPDNPTNYSANKPIAELSSTDCSDDGSGIIETCDESLGEIESKPSGYEEFDPSCEEKIVEARQQGDNEGALVENMKAKADGVALWWKLPLDLMKYCLFKARPVWTLSVAAAMMGVVILGRRLYKMKQKTRSLQLKLTMDDKKVSQVMSRAARLNEAFSVVKRSPIIRPSLPAAGVSPWAMMALR